MSEFNLLLGNKIVEHIVKGETDFSFIIDAIGVEYKCTTIAANELKFVYATTTVIFNRSKFSFPSAKFALIAVYSNPNNIILMNGLESTKQEAISFNEIKHTITQKVKAAVCDLVRKIKYGSDDKKQDSKKAKAIQKIAWLISLDDLDWEDICPELELSDEDIIYVWFTGKHLEIAEQFVRKNYTRLARSKAIYEAAKEKAHEYYNDSLLPLYKKLKLSKSDMFKVYFQRDEGAVFQYISRDGLIDGVRNRFEIIPALGCTADAITGMFETNIPIISARSISMFWCKSLTEKEKISNNKAELS